MNNKPIAPFGGWPSPISATAVAAGSTPLSFPSISGTDIYWLEGRASEGGRVAIMKLNASGERREINPAPWNARSRVHEYGGRAYAVAGDTIYFSHFADHRIYAISNGGEARAVTRGGEMRYADLVIDPSRDRLIAVREDHTQAGAEPVNCLVAVALDDSGAETVLVEGCDFYASPRLSPDGDRLTWLSWNHPNMPWDGCELWLAEFDSLGRLVDKRKIAGGDAESVFQPEWSSYGRLHFVSDRSGWWNLYRVDGEGITPLCPMAAEFGRAQWQFGMTLYGFAGNGDLVCAYIQDGLFTLARVDAQGGALTPIATPYTDIQDIVVGDAHAVLIAGAAARPYEVVRLDLATGETNVLAESVAALPEPGYVSTPHALNFPTTGGQTAHAFYYPPANADFAAPADQAPPLIVISHGGPTSMTTGTLKLSTQFWTSRGFALLDVNYRGSIGYGRAYREALNGQWGIYDVDDCEYGARFVAEQGLADPGRLIIRGASAGGFTTLCALAFHNVFKAGASHFGVADLALLEADTHKFESRYEIRLVGSRDLYAARSPAQHAQGISCPVIFFQGLDDKVVPPSQSEAMVQVLRARHLPVAYVTYEGEGHGFRKAENIRRTLEAEWYFYSRVFGFPLPEALAPVAIENL
jgi:dipeptidyl aminopeptidase/acylaminoacyl peptidase